MPKIPSDISGQDAVKAFQRTGWTVSRYGPHIIRSLLRHAYLIVEEFLKLVK